ncbi:hypothetical protein MLD38_011311 [Melastoma candidum]|uniref:Uncharacterized protein n=1 Tax=Melastoma candidum TaxID=119954 RepID=A0ACB9R2N0_9MYRT|nr:hypothetical protein MLD38_011311 [Melastoma candidum]
MMRKFPKETSLFMKAFGEIELYRKEQLNTGSKILKEAPLSLGGPLIQQRFPLVALTQKVIRDGHPEVVPGVVYYLNQSATMKVIEEIMSGVALATEYWFFWAFRAGAGASFLTRQQEQHGQSATIPRFNSNGWHVR